MELNVIADQTIVPARNKKVLIKDSFKTKDIVAEVIECFRQSAPQVAKFAPYLKGHNVKDTCKRIWHFLKENIHYQVDPRGSQWIKEPSRVWQDKFCDCKSYSIFIASLLKALGIEGVFRFVSFSNNPAPTHVYVVVRNQGRDIIIDDVMPAFNTEKAYIHKKDYPMSGLYRVSGIPTERGLAIISGANPKPGQFVWDKYYKRKVMVHGANTRGDLYFIGPDHEPVRRNEFIFPLPKGKEKPAIGSLPVIDGIGCNCNPQMDGFFDNIFRGAKKVLKKKGASKQIRDLASAFIYMYFPTTDVWFRASDNMFFNTLPLVVRQKAKKANDFNDWMHYNWGQDWEDIGHIIHNQLTANLGMEPQHYLALAISPDIDSYTNKTFLGVGVLPVAAATFVASMFKKLSSVQLPADFNLQNFAPAPTDWAGFKTRKPLFVVQPTIHDPLGTGINNGLYSTNGTPTQAALSQYDIPVFDLQGNRMNIKSSSGNGLLDTAPGAKKSGISPLLMIGLGGAAIAMAMSSKKKGKKRKK